jgi:environmental stress-induced protein Ves
MKKKAKSDGEFAVLVEGSALKSVPWKNGVGSTKEIAIFPPLASLAQLDFLWRFSTAEVIEPGPFSSFPDFDRLLTLVQGEELMLSFHRIHKALKPGMVLHFQGEEKVSSKLPKGPITDLGLIFDRDQVMAKMSLVELAERPRSFALTAPTVLLFCIAGNLQAMVYPGEHAFEMSPGDTLRVGSLPEERVVFLDPGKSHVKLAAVEISLVRAKSQS